MTGVASVTFRSSPVQDVAALAADAGLRLVEWAGDVHVPAADHRAADRARTECGSRGLEIGTYGSYHKAGESDPDGFASLVGTAAALGAPRIRVWAGVEGSAGMSPHRRAMVTDAVRRCAEEAADAGLELLVEHHVDTLTDTLDSALRLHADVAGLARHWQPRELPDGAQCLREVEKLTPVTVHAFSWGAEGYHERLPLGARADLWRPVLAALAAAGGRREVLLEFVADDAPHSLLRDAGDLNSWVDAHANFEVAR